MKLEQSFTVEASPDVVYAALTDVARVAPCLPGASIDEASEDGTYTGTFQVKLGPTTANYNGTLKMESLDETTRTATMSARGTDKRGQGGATASIVSVVHDDGGKARVEVVTDFSITGRLARFGRSGMIEDISNRLLRDFATCLQSKLAVEQPPAASAAPAESTTATSPPPAPAAAAPPPAAKPIGGLSLFFGALLDRIKRRFKRDR